jgi:hypothetical protein
MPVASSARLVGSGTDTTSMLLPAKAIVVSAQVALAASSEIGRIRFIIEFPIQMVVHENHKQFPRRFQEINPLGGFANANQHSNVKKSDGCQSNF